MDRREIVLAALTPGNGALHRPVQVQKLLFLIDRSIADQIGGPFFDFQPYNYGPFDKGVYEVLEELAGDGLVEIVRENTWNDYQLTPAGQSGGDHLLRQLHAPVRDYIVTLSNFVRGLSFTQLVTAIYRAYPDMRANSIFQG